MAKPNSTSFKKGQVSWCKGKHLSEEHKAKISKANMGHKHTDEWKKNHSSMMSGANHPFYGKSHSEKARDKISASLKGKCGELSRNWRGGLVTLTKLIRHSFEYRQWRSDIFTRDNFTCTNCGRIRCYLEADHIKPFSVILQENKINSFEDAKNCQELWNINNGRTLCKQCHDKCGIRKGITKFRGGN